MVVIIPLMLTGISYDSYFKGSSEVLNDFAATGGCRVGLSLYMSSYTRSARAGNRSSPSVLSAAWLVMVTGTSVALLMGASPEIAASILLKSVTTPIANGGWRQYWRYSGNQRSLRDFRRHPRRGIWPYIA